MKASELEIKYAMVDIVGDLDKGNCRDMFKIMQNREEFDYFLFNCLIYLFSEHVNGFFDVYSLHAIIDSRTSFFQNKEAADDRSAYLLSLFDRFGFIESKIIDDDVVYVRSTIDDAGFRDFVRRANKFCKEFEQILDLCLDVFKEWIVYSEHNKIRKKND